MSDWRELVGGAGCWSLGFMTLAFALSVMGCSCHVSRMRYSYACDVGYADRKVCVTVEGSGSVRLVVGESLRRMNLRV